jgi:putative hydrolase of the HAD superfamily
MTEPLFDVIAFDADDTLWDNERLYSGAKQEWLELLSECADPAECARRLEEIEIHNVRYYGYGIKSFVLSMIEAALVLTEKQVAAEKIASILAFAKRMLAAEVRLIDGAAETLAALHPRYPLMLITKGDPSEQQRKIDESGLAGFFRWVEIVSDKTPAAYQAILARYHLKPERFLMVGNSLRSDVLPVLQIGGQAVYVPFANTWSHELDIDPTGHPAYVTLENLGQLVGYLNGQGRDHEHSTLLGPRNR